MSMNFLDQVVLTEGARANCLAIRFVTIVIVLALCGEVSDFFLYLQTILFCF
jgi:hypothetical protein